MDGNLHTVLQVCFDSGVGRRHGEGAVGVVRDLIFRELWWDPCEPSFNGRCCTMRADSAIFLKAATEMPFFK